MSSIIDLRNDIKEPQLYVNSTGNCAQFAATTVAEHTHWKQTGVHRKFSERFLIYHAYPQKPTGRSSRTGPTFECFSKVGICLNEDWSFPPWCSPELETPPPHASAHAILHKSYNIQLDKTDINSILRHLGNGRIFAVRLDIDGTLWNQFWGVHAHIPMPTDPETLDVGHGVAIVGYDKLNYRNSPGGGRFIFRNNWGNNWGDNGYGTIPFDYVKRYGVNDSSEKSLATLRDEYCVSSRSPCHTISGIGVACHRGRLCIFYPHSDSRIYMQTYDGEHWLGESCVSYDGKGLTRGMIAPVSYSKDGCLYIFYKGTTSSHIFMRRLENRRWSTESDICVGYSWATSEPVCACEYNGLIYLFYRGRTTKNIYYNRYKYYDSNIGGKWLGQVCLSSVSPGMTNKALACTVHNNKLYIAYKGATTNSIYINTLDGNRWVGEKRVVSSSSGTDQPPTLVSNDGDLFLFYKRANESSSIHGSVLCKVMKAGVWKPSFSITEHSPMLTDSTLGAASYKDRIFLICKGQKSSSIWCNSAWYRGFKLTKWY